MKFEKYIRDYLKSMANTSNFKEALKKTENDYRVLNVMAVYALKDRYTFKRLMRHNTELSRRLLAVTVIYLNEKDYDFSKQSLMLTTSLKNNLRDLYPQITDTLQDLNEYCKTDLEKIIHHYSSSKHILKRKKIMLERNNTLNNKTMKG